MKRSRLAATLLASLFVLHLTVAGGIARALQPAGMAGMDMVQAAPDAAMTMGSAMDSSSSDEAPCPDETPCGVPGMPGNCPSALSCALAYSPVSENAALDVLLPSTVVIASSQVPHTRTSPPELPPPRA